MTSRPPGAPGKACSPLLEPHAHGHLHMLASPRGARARLCVARLEDQYLLGHWAPRPPETSRRNVKSWLGDGLDRTAHKRGTSCADRASRVGTVLRGGGRGSSSQRPWAQAPQAKPDGTAGPPHPLPSTVSPSSRRHLWAPLLPSEKSAPGHRAALPQAVPTLLGEGVSLCSGSPRHLHLVTRLRGKGHRCGEQHPFSESPISC